MVYDWVSRLKIVSENSNLSNTEKLCSLRWEVKYNIPYKVEFKFTLLHAVSKLVEYIVGKYKIPG